MSSTPISTLSARANVQKRHHGADSPEYIEAAREHASAAIAAEIGKRLAGEIQLTEDQVTEITGLLRRGAK